MSAAQLASGLWFLSQMGCSAASSGADSAQSTVYYDADGDGYLSIEECNDADAFSYPGGSEIPYDGVDQDCDGSDLTDQDLDGYDASSAGGGDCDDEDAETHPDISEECDGGFDRDCDGSAGYYDTSCCSLDCGCDGNDISDVWVDLSCASTSRSCDYDYDGYDRPTKIECAYSNGTSFVCYIQYNSVGYPYGKCQTDFGGGQECTFDC